MTNAASPRARRQLGALTGKRTVAVGVGVAVLGAVAVGLGPPWAAPTGQPPGSSVDAAASPALPPGFLEFRSPQDGFALGYPADWTRLNTADPQVALLANRGTHSVLVRVADLPTQVGQRELPAAVPMTDRIVRSDPSVTSLVEPKQLTVGGLPGLFYLYSFTDPETGLTGAHSHFFLFKGKTMIVLVFQALPADQFQGGAATFDQIVGTFRVV